MKNNKNIEKESFNSRKFNKIKQQNYIIVSKAKQNNKFGI